MATFIAIPEKRQTATTMRRVLDYVMQDRKILINGIKLVSGQNCVPESSYQEFMATKHRYGKATGVFFKPYVQSFKPNCGATPEQIHQIGLEMAKVFDGFEVVVATHIDRDHWHNHFIVNSVNCETGYKIQINEKGLEKLRQRSDEIMRMTVKDNLFQALRIMDENMKSIRYSVEVESSNQTNRLRKIMHPELKNMMNELKAKDLKLWKFKLKWAAVGAILPSIVCILQLILR